MEESSKILLINPPSPFENVPAMDVPLGLAYLSAYIKSKGFTNVSLLDYNTLNYNYEETQYLDAIPVADVYGITVTTPHFLYLHQMADRIKQIAPKSTIIAGGSHPSARPYETLSKTETDMVIRGEGEQVFHAFLKTGKIPDPSVRYIIKDLDALPFPDRDLVSPAFYKRKLNGKQAFHVVSARDCPYACSFCSKLAVGTKLRMRSVGNFINELMLYEDKYGVTSFVIYDDTFTIHKKRAIEIARAMGNLGYQWRCFTRTDKLDAEVVSEFRKNNITSITLGVETFSPKMLKVYNKQSTVEDNLKGINLCKGAGIPVRCSLIYGGPYETRETLQDTIDMVEHTQPDEWNVATFVPIPGCHVATDPLMYGVTIHPDPFYRKYHRVGESGMGEVMMDISTMTPQEYVDNRKWFVEELERVCPRTQIQDTIQELNI